MMKKNLKFKVAIVGATSILLSLIVLTHGNAAVKAGSTCSKAGQKTTISSVKYICTKMGKKLTWQAEKVTSTSAIADIKPGQWLVGKEVKPGIYRTTAATCYYQRLSGFTGSFNEIISNGNASGGSAIIEILATDKGFESRCSWNRLDVQALRSQTTTKTQIPSGQWIVGGEVKPGTYRTTATTCYWERQSSLTGGFDSIISNGNAGANGAIVTIEQTDIAFRSRCAWDAID